MKRKKRIGVKVLMAHAKPRANGITCSRCPHFKGGWCGVFVKFVGDRSPACPFGKREIYINYHRNYNKDRLEIR